MAMIGENEDTIHMLSKEQLKKVVKTKINEVVLKDLQEQQTKHSKIKNIIYNSMNIKKYMANTKMSNSMVETMVAVRSSIVRGVRANFSAVQGHCRGHPAAPAGVPCAPGQVNGRRGPGADVGQV